jgi:DNA-binding transcriptional ArsR family regulator
MITLFDAVADPTRRQILERLRTSGPLSLSEIAGRFPITRQAITKHLDALAACGLVRTTRAGRERIHELDPQPLVELQEWLAPYAAEWDRRLDRLHKHLEGVR